MVSSSSSSSSSSSKRIRNGSLMSSCLVDGCVSDLSRCKEYHRKHKVCDIHSKTPIVMVGGREQRFCQQCSRFHLLMEFDGEKRSCRKRLEGHNRRRRKPQLHSLNPEAFLTHQGSRFISSYPQIFSTNSNTWAPAPKAEEMAVYPQGLVFNGHPHNNYEHFPVSSRGVYNNENLDAAASTSTACQRKLFESECALSLLSSPTSGDRISSMGQQQQQPRIHSMPMHYHDAFRASSSNASISHNNGFFYSGVMEHEQGGSVLISGSSSSDADLCCRGLPHEQAGSVLISGSTSNDADLYCHGLLHEQGSSNANSHAALSFSWQ